MRQKSHEKPGGKARFWWLCCNAVNLLFGYICNTALMLSALKAEGVSYSPASIKRVLENTAAPLSSHDKFSIGHGVLQVRLKS